MNICDLMFFNGRPLCKQQKASLKRSLVRSTVGTNMVSERGNRNVVNVRRVSCLKTSRMELVDCSLGLCAGDRYVVVDCGGGTVDLTVHQIRLPEGHLKELYKASGSRTLS